MSDDMAEQWGDDELAVDTTTNPGLDATRDTIQAMLRDAKADELARIERIIEGRKKPHPCVWNEWMDDLLAAIRGGDDA